MLFRLLLLFTLVPLIELVVLVWFSHLTSLPVTIVLILATGVAGAALARWQGLVTWRRIQEQLRRGELPGEALLDGLMILVAGALLITPGLLTDVVGFAFLVPLLRRGLRRGLAAWLRVRIVVGSRRWPPEGPADARSPASPEVIDADFTRRPDERQDADRRATKRGQPEDDAPDPASRSDPS